MKFVELLKLSKDERHELAVKLRGKVLKKEREKIDNSIQRDKEN